MICRLAAAATRRGWRGGRTLTFDPPWPAGLHGVIGPDRLGRIRRDEPGSLFGRNMNFRMLAMCAELGIPDLGESFRAPVQSNMPVLCISGEMDVRTPPAEAGGAGAARFSGSRPVQRVASGSPDRVLRYDRPHAQAHRQSFAQRAGELSRSTSL